MTAGVQGCRGEELFDSSGDWDYKNDENLHLFDLAAPIPILKLGTLLLGDRKQGVQ